MRIARNWYAKGGADAAGSVNSTVRQLQAVGFEWEIAASSAKVAGLFVNLHMRVVRGNGRLRMVRNAFLAEPKAARTTRNRLKLNRSHTFLPPTSAP